MLDTSFTVRRLIEALQAYDPESQPVLIATRVDKPDWSPDYLFDIVGVKENEDLDGMQALITLRVLP
jgi:hypothetical protein